MKIKHLLIALLALMLISCASKDATHPKLNSLFESYWAERAQYFPLEATTHGNHRFNHVIVNDQTEAYRQKLKTFYRDYLARLKAIDVTELVPTDQTNFQILRYDLEMGLAELETNLWMIPFHQFWGLPLSMPQLGSGESYQPFNTVKDYQNWLQRIDDFSEWVDSAIQNFKIGMRKGYVLPAALVQKMIQQMKHIRSKEPQQSIFWGPIKKFPSNFSAQEKNALSLAYSRAIDEQINPTYLKLEIFLRNSYLPKARKSSGIGVLPGGKSDYAFLVKLWTTTDLTPEQIYQTGLSEVARIRAQMEQIKDKVDFKGNLSQFFQHLRNHPSFMPYQRADQVLEDFRKIQSKIEPKLKYYFKNTPKTPFEIRQTEKYREMSSSAEYNVGALNEGRAGVFYIPIPDPKKFNITSGMESLFLHEAIPGHHYQISLQQENDNQPSFRRFAWYGAMGEGWALYTESLGEELGLYQDPYQKIGALKQEIHRALRLVVDVGLHLKHMTRQQAIQYLMSNEPISLQDATSEVERYMAIPGQALSYKIGALKIQQLRDHYAKQLGKRFDIADFHQQLLQDGVMPLQILEQKLNRWAEFK